MATEFRSRRIPLLWLILLGFLMLLHTAQSARAQDYLAATGSPTFSTNLPVEAGFIDMANGNLHLEIPLGSFPQRGSQGYSALLVYDSRIWKQMWAGPTGTWQPTNVPNSQAGWRFVVTAAEGAVTYHTTSTQGPPPRNCITTKYDNFTWTDPLGTPHLFPGQTTQVSQGCGAGSSTAGGLAVDSTGLKIGITNYTVATVLAPDGTQLYPSREDTNGNFFSKDANGNIVDTLGRTPVTVTTSCTGDPNKTCYDVLNSQGTTPSRFTVTKTSISVNTAFGQSGLTEYSGPLTAIQSIQLPDNTTYQFGYDSGTSSGHYGSLTSVTLPTLGQVTYGYTTYQDSFGNKNRWITSRTSGGGLWTFTPTVGTTCSPGTTGCTQKVEVTKPSGDATRYIFTLNNGAWAGTMEFYSGPILVSNMLASVSTSFDMTNPCVTPGCTGNQYIRAISRAKTMIGGGFVSLFGKTEYTYDTPQNGNITAIKAWKYYSGFPATPDRETDFTYLSTSAYTAKNIINRVLSMTVKDNGSPIAQTNFTYDDTGTLLPSTPATGIAHHDDANYGISNTVRGNLTKTQRCTVLTSCGTSYVQTALTNDTTGQVLSAQDPKLNTTNFSYADYFFTDNGANPPAPFTPTSPTNAYVKTVTPPLNGALTFGYYYNTGKRASSVDQNSADSYSHFLDVLDRQTHAYGPVAPSGARPWALSAYAPNSETQIDTYLGINDTLPSTGCSSCRNDRVLLDPLGRATTQSVYNDPEGATTTTTNYDTSGRILNVSHPARTAPSTTDGVETPTYDGLNRTIKVTHQDNSYSQVFYGAAVSGTGVNLTQLCTPTTTYGLGYPTLLIDEAGKRREIWSDGFGRTIEADEPDSSGSLNSNTCYKYDSLGNLLQIVHGTQTRTYAYDAPSRVTSVSIPEISNAQGQQCAVTYTYDNNSNIQTRTKPAPNQTTCTTTVTTTYSWDALNRATGKSYSDGSTASVTYFYDQTSYNGLTITNGKGRRTGMSDASGSTAWSYDASGKILTERRTIAGVAKTISYSYNLDGSPKTITYPGNRQVTYTASNAQRLTEAKDLVTGTQFALTASYAPPGGLQSVTFGKINGGFGGMKEEHTANNHLEYTLTKAYQVDAPAVKAIDLSYGYALPGGNNGSVASITNNVDNGRTETVQYDPLNRISLAASQATSGVDCWGQSHSIDSVANLMQITLTQCSGFPLNVTVDGNNHIIGTGFSYDAAGNMTQDGSGYTYTFDSEGRISKATGMSGGPYCYIYDGKGLRVEKMSNATTCASGTITKLYWRSVNGKALAESDSGGSTTNAAYMEYVFFAGRRIASRNGPGTVYYYFADPLGTPRAITDANGSLCYDADFTPYGQEMPHTNTCPSNYKFTDYEWDSETGLYYAFARYYSPRLGRFLSTDPIGGAVGIPQSHNAYSYVANDPVNMMDPLGLGPCRKPLPTGACPGRSSTSTRGGDFCANWDGIETCGLRIPGDALTKGPNGGVSIISAGGGVGGVPASFWVWTPQGCTYDGSGGTNILLGCTEQGYWALYTLGPTSSIPGQQTYTEARLNTLTQAERIGRGPMNVMSVVFVLEVGGIVAVEATPAIISGYQATGNAVISIEVAYPGVAMDIIDILGPTPSIGATKIGMVFNLMTNVLPKVYDFIADHTWRNP